LAQYGKILVLNGPNLNMLGTREPEIYGKQTLADIEANCRKTAENLGFDLDFRQSNSEGELVGWIQQSTEAAAIIINPAAYTHTSVAIRDALALCVSPVIELHISNIFRREPFRHESMISGVATGLVCGFGPNGYMLAIHAARDLLENG